MSNTVSNTKVSTTTILGVILGLIVFMRTMPCYLWSVEDTIRPILAIIVLIICLFNISKEKGTFWIFLCFALAYIWAVVFVDRSGIVTLFNFLAFAFIPILRKDLVFETYKTFYRLIVFFLSLSIVNYLFVRIGLTFGGIEIEPLNSLKSYKYIMYMFLVEPSGGSGRFHGLWDEPGFIGTICGLLLVAERMNLRKKGNWIILIGGLLSLSFYFYLALIMGLVLFSSRLKRKWLVMVFFFTAFLVAYNNTFLYNTIWYRFEWDEEEGTLAGDNRNTGSLTSYYESIKGTPAWFTGVGTSVAKDYAGSASLKLIIVKHGFIFVFLMLSGFAILSLREIRNKLMWLAFFIFFVLTLYQRPGFYNTYSIFFYAMVIYVFGSLETEKQTIEQQKSLEYAT
jgi:hypothetical protein